MFTNTLNVVPSGILLIEIKSQAITFANKEMLAMLDTQDQPGMYSIIKEKVSRYVYPSKQ